MAKRPVSPHVFEITGVQPHYKFPLGAISSITNRATGCMLSVGAFCCLLSSALPLLPCSYRRWWQTLDFVLYAAPRLFVAADPVGGG